MSHLLDCPVIADLDWQALTRASMHPAAVRILERALASPGERFSLTKPADEFGEKLGNVSYHVRVLRKAGLVKTAGTRTVRWAVQHFYIVSEKALR